VEKCQYCTPHDDIDDGNVHNDMPLCANGEYSWACASRGGGHRVQCPAMAPIMCAYKRCDGDMDYCCEVDCGRTAGSEPFGGPRLCPCPAKIGETIRFTSSFTYQHQSIWLEKKASSPPIDTPLESAPDINSSWVVRSGAGNGSISFESKQNPGRFLRHRGYSMYEDQNDGSYLFKEDASFYEREPLWPTCGFSSYEFFNMPGFYLRRTGYGMVFGMDKLFVANESSKFEVNHITRLKLDATWKLE